MSSFQSRIESLFTEFQITYDPNELKFIGIRDKIVHTGDFPPNTNGWDEYSSLMNLLDRTILTILGYKGNYYLNRVKGYSYEALK